MSAIMKGTEVIGGLIPTPTVKNIASATSDANGFINLGIPNDNEVLSVSSVGFGFLAWKRSNGYWYATVLNGSNSVVANTTVTNIKVSYA